MQNADDVQAYLDKNCKGDAANSLQGQSVQPGDLKFVDVNGDGVINEDDKTEVGNPHPDITMGLSFNVGYKGFDLAVTTYGAFGQQNMRSYRKFTDGNVENYTSEVFEYWHGEGTSNRYPRLVPGNTVSTSNRYPISSWKTLAISVSRTLLWATIQEPTGRTAHYRNYVCT